MNKIIIPAILFSVYFLNAANGFAISGNTRTIQSISITFKEAGEYRTTEISADDWQSLLESIRSANYDFAQSSFFNPFGYQAKVREQDYRIVLYYKKSSRTDIVLLWNDDNGECNINLRWYLINNQNRKILFDIITKYTTMR